LVDIELGEQNELHILLEPKTGHRGEVQVGFVYLGRLALNPSATTKMKFEIDDLPVLHTI